MKESGRIEQKLFRPEMTEKRPLREVISQARLLFEKLSELEEILPIVPHDGKTPLKYFANLYMESRQLVTAITDYIVNNGLSGIDTRVDSNIVKIQEVLGYLKILHEKYKSEDNQVSETELSNAEIIKMMQKILSGITILSKKTSQLSSNKALCFKELF